MPDKSQYPTLDISPQASQDERNKSLAQMMAEKWKSAFHPGPPVQQQPPMESFTLQSSRPLTPSQEEALRKIVGGDVVIETPISQPANAQPSPIDITTNRLLTPREIDEITSRTAGSVRTEIPQQFSDQYKELNDIENQIAQLGLRRQELQKLLRVGMPETP